MKIGPLHQDIKVKETLASVCTRARTDGRMRSRTLKQLDFARVISITLNC